MIESWETLKCKTPQMTMAKRVIFESNDISDDLIPAVDATLRYLNSIEFAGVPLCVNFKSFKKLFLQMV